MNIGECRVACKGKHPTEGNEHRYSETLIPLEL